MLNLKEHDLLNCVPWYMYHCIVMSSLLTELMFKGLIHILDIVLYVLRFEGEIKKKGQFSENILCTTRRIVSIALDIYVLCTKCAQVVY